MDFSEKWGVNVEEAVRLALMDLQTTEDQVKVIVLEEPSKGFLGFGSKLAKVRVERIKAPEPEQPEKKEKEQPEKLEKKEIPAVSREFSPEPKSEPKKESSRPKGEGSRIKSDSGRRREKEYKANLREKPEGLVEIQDTPALDFLKTLAEKMNLELSIKAYQNEECIYMDIIGKDSGTIIGKRGQTLDSIQYLTSLVVNKDTEKYIKVIVDAENYRAKREKTLEQLANRLADKVRRTGKSVRLEPMNPYERKVIHATLQKHPGVTTRSEGEEPYRRVIIEQK